MASASIAIVGASVRAAAFSALRAGLTPTCFDLFADCDLRARCRATAVAASRYPFNLLQALRFAPPGPWMYTGALENYARLVERIASERPLWGNDASALRRARDPFFVVQLLRDAGLPAPLTLSQQDRPAHDMGWLAKPLAGAGKFGIRFWSDRSSLRRREYLQEFIEGESVAAVFVAQRESTRFLGVTRQLVGEPWVHARPFAYCGSIGPITVSGERRDSFDRIGQVLADACALRGLFGVDAVIRDGLVYPVEVNPRYTASVEVLEFATGLSALARHRRAFEPNAPATEESASAHSIVGKAVYFAPAALSFPSEGPWLESLCDRQAIGNLPRFADIPAPGASVNAGAPVLTFFVHGATIQDCHAALRQRAQDLDRLLYPQ